MSHDSWRTKAFQAKRFDVVVKLGGSVVWSDRCEAAARTIALAGKIVRVLVVPGGGEPDNVIEVLHKSRPLDSETFHRATLLAQDQTGLVLCNGSDELIPVRSVREATRVVETQRVAVLLPHDIFESVDVFRYTNRVSSDSMALWTAGLVGAERVLIVKSREPHQVPVSPRSLAADEGFVDEIFPDLMLDVKIPTGFVGVNDLDALYCRLIGSDTNLKAETWVP